MGNHRKEIAVGRLIPVGRPTIYLCHHNHYFVVHGPHAFCKCRSAARAQLIAKPAGHCGCEYRRPNKHDHKHPDGTESYTRSDCVYMVCGCGSAPKKLITREPKVLALAEAAYRIGGLQAMLPVLNIDWLRQASKIEKYEWDYEVPIDYPAEPSPYL